jgi:hypothetical protein
VRGGTRADVETTKGDLMSNSEPVPEPEGPEPELKPATMPEGEPGVMAPEPKMLPEKPDITLPDPEEERI